MGLLLDAGRALRINCPQGKARSFRGAGVERYPGSAKKRFNVVQASVTSSVRGLGVMSVSVAMTRDGCVAFQWNETPAEQTCHYHAGREMHASLLKLQAPEVAGTRDFYAAHICSAYSAVPG